MRRLIRAFDGFLRRTEGVFEFSQAADCLLRLRVTHSKHALTLPGVALPAGATVLELHLWNEHMPPMPAEGPDMAWAARTTRMFVDSLYAVGQYMKQEPRLLSVQAVGGVTVLVVPDGNPAAANVLRRLGFHILPYRNRLGRFGEFWENFYTWWIMWTFNAVSLRRRGLMGMRRTEMWTPAVEFIARFGREKAPAQRPAPD